MAKKSLAKLNTNKFPYNESANVKNIQISNKIVYQTTPLGFNLIQGLQVYEFKLVFFLNKM